MSPTSAFQEVGLAHSQFSRGLLDGALVYLSVEIGIEELAQFINLALQLDTLVGVAYAHPRLAHLYQLCGRDNVSAFADNLFG